MGSLSENEILNSSIYAALRGSLEGPSGQIDHLLGKVQPLRQARQELAVDQTRSYVEHGRLAHGSFQ